MDNPDNAPAGKHPGGNPLAGRSVLVIEDEPYLAEELADYLTALGMVVVGPFPSTQRALIGIEGRRLDCAVLDINLNGETSYSIAELLADREVPFLFMSGYSRDILPARFSSQPMVKKPMYPGELRAVMTTMLA